MSDVHDKETRSYNMSRIRGKNTKPELYVRKFLYANGIRYRIHYSKLPGKPDIAITSKKILIDIKGCYWHRHAECKYATTPKTNVKFYEKKFNDTVSRDLKNKRKWEKEGWRVIEVWECELKTIKKREKRLIKLIEQIKK